MARHAAAPKLNAGVVARPDELCLEPQLEIIKGLRGAKKSAYRVGSGLVQRDTPEAGANSLVLRSEYLRDVLDARVGVGPDTDLVEEGMIDPVVADRAGRDALPG